MSLFKLRPTFEIALSIERQAAIARLEELEPRTGHIHLLLHGEYGELHLPKDSHRLWSPHLSFYVAEREGRGLIYGRFAPRIEVWTFVWIVYLAMSFSSFYGFALGYSQWMLKTSPWGLMVGFLSIAVILTLYLIALVGQQWSADQMLELRQELECILADAGLRKSSHSA